MSFITKIAVILLVVTAVACSGDSPVTSSDPDMTGERFFDAAASRFMDASPGLIRTQANCMVTHMTADGVIGLGEINQMALDINGLQEIPRLRDAYYAAMNKCTVPK